MFVRILKPTSGSRRNQTSTTESGTSGRTMLGKAGAGEICVSEGVGKMVGRTGAQKRWKIKSLALAHIPLFES